MNASLLTGLAVGAAVVLLALLIVLKRGTGSRKPRETEMVALVRRRRELNVQLAGLAGDQSRQLLQAEARRMRASSSDIAVLEAAVARAERLSDRSDLRADTSTR